VQAGVLTGEVKDMLLLDVTPLSLGIETLGGVMTKLIERNTTIPTRKSQIFSTAADSQTSVEVHVLQGEREMASGNRTLGRFHLDGIPPAPRGVPQVEVSFDIDANGIVHVGAKDMATQKEQKITITSSSGLDKNDIDRLVKEAKSHEAEDKKLREEIEMRNQADSLIYSTERMIKDNKDKIDAKAKTDAEKAIEECKKAVEAKDADKIKKAMEELQQATYKISEALYKSAAPKQEGSTQEGQTQESGSKEEKDDKKKDEKVVDAEFEESKEE